MKATTLIGFAGARLAVAIVSAALGCASDPAPTAPSCDGGAPGCARAPLYDAPARAAADAPWGTWYLAVGGARLTLTLTREPASGALSGAMEPDGAAPAPLADVSWESASGTLRFRRTDAGSREWFEADVVDGVMTGRVARAVGEAPPDASQYTRHLTGWSATALDRDVVPRAWDLRSDDGLRAKVRLDRGPSGEMIGTFKVYARDGVGAGAEELERDLRDVSWDGTRLAFSLSHDDLWTFEGIADGRRMRLDATAARGAATTTWSGARAEVLSHGLTPRPASAAAGWRERTRRRVAHLMMNGAPEAMSTRALVLRGRLASLAASPLVTSAFGGPARQEGYTVTELRFEHTLADPRGGPDIARVSHALLAHPNASPPPGGYPLAVAFNGHGGSAHAVMNPGSQYWYGDAYARRGYIVLAIDVSHRPVADRADLYSDAGGGDDPAHGNGVHPAIASAGFDTDWEEDGERAWDAMRALDHALARYATNPARVLAVGLSMGAEVATVFGALDTRVGAVVAAGFSPDLAVIRSRANHPCWRWRYADVEEYLDTSDYHALVAPRTLVVETGAVDASYSSITAPFASDKQVLRRSRAAFGDDARRLVHDLHPGGHVFHAGDPALDPSAEHGMLVPLLHEPSVADDPAWQTDRATRVLRTTVFDLTPWRARN